jgi:hypothetical protein
VDEIHDDLTSGANVASTIALKGNGLFAREGFKPHGLGFLVSKEKWEAWGWPKVVHPYRNGKDISERPRDQFIIDLFGMTEEEVKNIYPDIYQHVFDHVKPERDQNNRENRKKYWWLFGEPNPGLHSLLNGCYRYIVTSKTAKHRVFQFLDETTLPDSKLITFAFNDSYILGILSSRIHLVWSGSASSALGVGNDPTYVIRRCFDPFPFPAVSEEKRQVVGNIAERLDAHRKAAQGRGVTITQMYNLLEKLRSGEPFSSRDQVQHQAAQTEILRQLHDELDQAVLDAYGWPAGIEDAEILERLVALNRERAAEEAKGVVRWLRPEYQCPEPIQPITQPLMVEEPEEAVQVTPVPVVAAQPWPKDLKEQLAALRGLLLSSDHLWTLEEIGAAFKSRGRYRESIQAHLGLLADLGVIVVLETADGVRFHRPQALGA